MKIHLIELVLRADSFVAATAPETGGSSGPLTGSDHQPIQMPLRRDAQGRPTVSAATIAGSIRAHLQPDLREAVMGRVEGNEAERSALSILSVDATLPGATATEIRTRTSIDRVRGGPAKNKLFNGEGLPVGTELRVRMQLVGDDSLASTLLKQLATWSPRLGRGVTTGAGRLSQTTLTAARLDFDNNSDLVSYLTHPGPQGFDRIIQQRGSDRSRSITTSEPRWALDVRMDIVDAIHIGSGASTGNLLLMQRDSAGRSIVPGTSLKGVFRTRSEFILRSIGVDLCRSNDCGTCPVCELFGYTLESPTTAGITGRRGFIAFHDAAVQNSTEVKRAHVAIDRVSGGVRDGALFEVESVEGGWLEFRIEQLEDLPSWAKGLLLAVLADIDAGYVGVGGATTRGYGSLRVSDGDRAVLAGGEALAALRSLTAKKAVAHGDTK